MKTTQFHRLHDLKSPLLLPNAWDAGSARVIESCGAKAIATTSAGLAWACGYPDGNHLPAKELFDAVRRIVRVVRVPISVDIEEGFAAAPDQVAANVEALVDLGVAGINIEDGTNAPALLAEKISAIRARLRSDDRSIFINARTDVCLRGMAAGEAAVDEILRRASLYSQAGCDGLFVPALTDLAQIKKISTALVGTPLNIMWLPGLASMDELHLAGVRRISAGAALSKNIMAQTQALASQYLAGDWRGIAGLPLDYAIVNEWFAQ
jgi:2-methylisocitrate lyase-like PEP mutase family enzyme